MRLLLSAALLLWGFRTLPEERWQMIAAVPVAKHGDGARRSHRKASVALDT